MARKWWKYIIDPTGIGERVFNGWSNFLSGKKGFVESFYGNDGLGDIFNAVGNAMNQASGDYASADYNDKIADENASVAYERQLALMDKEAEINSVGSKAQQLSSAGLNPVLASGVSNSVGGASAQMSSPNSGKGNMLGVIDAILGAQRLKSDIEVNKTQATKNLADAARAEADADLAKSQKDKTDSEKGLIDKQVAKFDENFDLDKSVKEAQANMSNKQANYYEKAANKVHHDIIDGHINSGARLLSALGVLIGTIKGFRTGVDPEVLIPEVVERTPNTSKPLDSPIELPQIGPRTLDGVKGFKNFGDMGRYMFDDGSTFEFGVNNDGPWCTTRGASNNSQAHSMENIWIEYIETMCK